MDHERPWRSCEHKPETDIPGWKNCRECNTAWRVKDEDEEPPMTTPPTPEAEALEKARDLAERWLRENDWDYQKYRDRRADRSAYDTMMNYEISGVLEDAFCAGYAAALTAERERALEDAANVAEAYWKDGKNVYARHAGRAVETRIRALKDRK